MTVLWIVLGALAVLIGILWIVPRGYDCSRKLVINAPTETLHQWIGDLKRWPEWDPWHVDQTLQVKLGEKTTGVGAHQSWTGKGGGGELTFTESSPRIGIAFELFLEQKGERLPQCFGAIRYTPMYHGTEVEWSMRGAAPKGPIGGMFKLLSGPLLGRMFDQGLKKLKVCAEGKPG